MTSIHEYAAPAEDQAAIQEQAAAITEDQAARVRDQAGAYFGNGFHCAEAVVCSVLEALGETPGAAVSHATAFGGGFGNTKAEACGALSGAMILIGHFFGRREPRPEWQAAKTLGAEVHCHFARVHGATCCQTLCAGLEGEAQMDRCRAIVRDLSGFMYERLTQAGIRGRD